MVAWLCLALAGAPAVAQEPTPEPETQPEAAPESEAAPELSPTEVSAVADDELPSPWPLLTVTLGVGTAGAGLFLALAGDGEKRGLSYDLGLVDSDGDVIGTTYAQAQSRLDDAEAKVIAGGVLLGLGLAAIVGGAVWAAMGGLDNPPDEEEAPALEEVRLLVSPSSLGVSGRF